MTEIKIKLSFRNIVDWKYQETKLRTGDIWYEVIRRSVQAWHVIIISSDSYHCNQDTPPPTQLMQKQWKMSDNIYSASLRPVYMCYSNYPSNHLLPTVERDWLPVLGHFKPLKAGDENKSKAW